MPNPSELTRVGYDGPLPPDYTNPMGWGKPIFWTCPRCQREIGFPSETERSRGWCAGCEVEMWNLPNKTACGCPVVREYQPPSIDELRQYEPEWT